MARKLNKGTKQILSLLFHVAVLGTMIVIYDGAKDLARKLGWIESTMSEGVGSAAAETLKDDAKLDTTIDKDLAKLVQESDQGYIFRTDLPFPAHVKILRNSSSTYDQVRVAGKSRFGSEPSVVTMIAREEIEYQRAGTAARVTIKRDELERLVSPSDKLARLQEMAGAEKSGTSIPPDRNKIINPLQGKYVQFSHSGGKWKAARSSEFKTMALGNELEETIEDELMRNGALPKTNWFGKEPLPVGKEIELAGPGANMVFDRGVKASLKLKLSGMEGVYGHPCVVFATVGSAIQEPADNGRGETERAEITVESGRIWCSLLYPVVLRVEMETLRSEKTFEGKKLISLMQGSVKESLIREWQIVPPKVASALKPKAAIPE